MPDAPAMLPCSLYGYLCASDNVRERGADVVAAEIAPQIKRLTIGNDGWFHVSLHDESDIERMEQIATQVAVLLNEYPDLAGTIPQ